MRKRSVVVAMSHTFGARYLPDILADQLEEDGFEVWRRSLADVRKAARHEERPIVVVLHWIEHLTRRSTVSSLVVIAKFVTLLALLRRRSVRVIWYFHNERPHESRHDLLDRGVRMLLERWLADRIIVMSAESMDALRSPRGRGRARLVPLPTFESSYGPLPDVAASRAALALPPAGTVLLFFGLIRPYKGVLELLDAFRRVTATDVSLVIAGACKDPDLAASVQVAAAADARVRLRLGAVDDADVTTLIAAADWMVLPYLRVLNSAVAMMAMSYEVPVIAPRIGALGSVLTSDDGTEAGVLYDPADDGLDVALDRALGSSDAERATFTSAAHAVRERSSIESVCARLAAVIDEVTS